MKITKTFSLLLFIALLYVSSSIQAQTNTNTRSKYMVYFTDKNGVEFDPMHYFHPNTIERRVKFGIPLNDITDHPVREDYIAAVKSIADSSTHILRWFNSITVIATPEQIANIENLPFVSQIELMQSQGFLTGSGKEAEFNLKLSEYNRELLEGQTTSLGLSDFQAASIDGKGIRVAIFDAGFPTVDINPAFEHIRSENRIAKTYDFLRKREYVYKASPHGTMVMSCVGGKFSDTLIGLAPNAEFLLARTENGVLEPFSEEENWLAAVEWADKNGADIVNSSLGYTKRRYFNTQMNGKTSLVSRAATLAARKGILVVNAAGNEGAGEWKYIATPGDADSVLTIGGVDHGTLMHTNFSSFGPTSDKRIKPNVCAYGHVIASGEAGLTKTQGTSFASPLIAGFAACAWQTNRDLSNMELYEEIQKSASLYPYFDYAHGYGIPQASYFTEEKKEKEPTFTIKERGDIIDVIIEDEYFDEEDYDQKLFYSISAADGTLEKYYVISVNQKNLLGLNKYKFTDGKKLNVSYKGYSSSYAY